MTDRPPLPITGAGISDLTDFAGHILRHVAESGTSGSVHFSPVWDLDRSHVMRETERRWRTPPHHCGWGRAWLLWTHAWNDPSEPRPVVVGHVELRGSPIVAALHRAELSIGVEAPYRGRGGARALMSAAVAWARDLEGLCAVDLRVFAHNEVARALYRAVGFQQVGLVRDAYRMRDGTSVDDVLMTLDVARPSP